MFRGLVPAALSGYDLARVAGNTCTTNPIINRVIVLMLYVIWVI